MKHNLKRLTALLLALSMALSLLCTSAWAAEVVPEDESTEPVAEEIVAEEIAEAPVVEEAPAESVEAVVEPEVPEVPAGESEPEDTEAEAVAEPEELNTDTASGTCGTSTTWTLDNGVLTISGEGSATSAPWASYSDSITKIVFESGVTSMKGFCIHGYKALTSVSIPSTMYNLGTNLYDCPKLTTIQVDSKSTYYTCKDNILYNASMTDVELCPAGKTGSITLPSTVTTVSNSAFYGCSGLTKITLPSKLTYISYYAFQNCTGLTSITIPATVKKIYDAAFEGCTGLTEVTIPKSVTTLGSSVFYGCTGLTKITIPSSITALKHTTFSGCTSLTEVTLPSSITSIDSYAFKDCTGLTKIIIPETVTDIYDSAFTGCTNLTIYGYDGTTAETFAKNQNIPFHSLGVALLKNTITASNITKNYSTKKQTISIKAKAKSGGKLTYSSNNKSITVNKSGKVTIKAKYIGKATITIKTPKTSKYKAATKTITVTARPTGTSITSLTNPSSGKLKVKWKKNSLATGYQVQYSYYDKTFEKGAYPTVTISKKTTTSKKLTYATVDRTYPYYVRVRTYKTVNGKKIYSAWSKTKSIRVKK